MLDQEGLPAFWEAIKRLDAVYSELPVHESKAPGIERLADTLNATAERLQDNYPYFHPLYAGQMLKPPHPVARLAYALAMWINPNNHALDGGRATSAWRRNDGESRGPVGFGTITSGKENSRQRASPLYTPADQRCLAIAIRNGSV